MERTDRLAKAMGISLRALAPEMDLSVASLFGYRNGTIQISAKAWRKLEHAEEQAARRGLHQAIEETKRLESRLMEDETPYLANVKPRDERIRDAFSDIRRGLDILENLLLSERK